jgi:membrane protein
MSGMLRVITSLPPLLRLVRRRFREDRCPQVAASLTYTTLLSLVPIITIALMVFSTFPSFGEITTQLKLFLLTNMVPESAGKIISVYMTQFSEKAARLTAVGIALLAVTAFMLMQTITQSFNVIWRVRRPRPLLQRFLAYWAVLTLGPLLVGASLSLTSYLLSLPRGWVKGIPLVGGLPLDITPLLLTIAALTLLYQVVPNRTVRFSHALVAGIIAGIAFELMKKLFTLYLSAFPSYTLVYGTFAALPIFLIWIYLSWLVVLIGAVIAAALPYWRSEITRHRRRPQDDFLRALAVLSALFQAQQNGDALRLETLQEKLHAGLEEIEVLLERLESARWASRTARGGWMLSRDATSITLADAFNEFVFHPLGPEELPEHLKAALLPWQDSLQAGLSGKGNLSLKTWCEADAGR